MDSDKSLSERARVPRKNNLRPEQGVYVACDVLSPDYSVRAVLRQSPAWEGQCTRLAVCNDPITWLASATTQRLSTLPTLHPTHHPLSLAIGGTPRAKRRGSVWWLPVTPQLSQGWHIQNTSLLVFIYKKQWQEPKSL